MAKGKMVEASFVGENVLAEDNPKSRELYDKSRLGEPKSGKFRYSLYEALFLIENKKMEVISRNNTLSNEEFTKKTKKLDKNFFVKYLVFKDLRSRGYIVKTALKFGAEFRVYEKGTKPGEGHARWIAFPVHESSTLTWHDLSAKSRVSHSTKKNLLIAVVDDESDVTYYEVAWKKP
jgi:tRNA-intron endonuclease